MEHAHQWYLSKEELACTPSRKSIDANKELSYRQQAANFIQDMGQRLQVSQLCINTAIVYMHRFYVYHSFTELHRNSVSVAALFLAAKVEEQPRKLEHVIKVAHICLHKDAPPLDVRSEAYADKQFEVVALESILLQTLGFTLAIEHPHTYVVKVCQLVKASKDLAQTSYFMATTSLHMTTMCLQYKPTIVACVCIHLACKWSSWKVSLDPKIEPCSEGKEWYFYVDKSVTLELLESLTQEFITILESSPHRFKRKFMPSKDIPRSLTDDSAKHHSADSKSVVLKKDVSSPGPSTSSSSSSFSVQAESKPLKVESTTKRPAPSAQSPPAKKIHPKVSSHSISIDAYREKKEKERLEQKPALPPTEVSVQPALNKPQHALNEHERVHKHPSNSLEPHSHLMKEKVNKSSANKDLNPVHAASVNKLNHQFAKKPESAHTRESKSNTIKLPSNVSSDPVVVLERVDVKPGSQEAPVPDGGCALPLPQTTPNKLTSIHSYKYAAPGENVVDSKEPPGSLSVSNSPVPKVKHHKHKTNSLHSNHNSAQTYTQRSSPAKDIKTNGSKEVDPNERRNAIENSVACVKTDNLSSKHEKREKHKIKHSSNSKEKSMSNHSEQSNPSIKVKIRKDIICLSESNQKSQTPPVKRESPKKTLKIKLPKPPAPEVAKGTTPTSLKLVITKDKSGSGSYCTSHKNDRESRKRIHSPSSQDAKHAGEASSKHPKLDHSHSSHPNVKQSKPRHSSSRNMDHSSNDVSNVKLINTGKESTGYLNVDVESYTGQPYYGNQYFPYQATPPPPPTGYRSKTNFNISLPTQPPLPPPE